MRCKFCLGIVAALLVSSTLGCRDPGRGEVSDGGLPPDADHVVPMEDCGNDIPAPTEGVCNVTSGSQTSILLRGDVLGPDTAYVNGTVLVQGDTITCVGCNCDSAPGAEGATRIDCANAAISPGLINPHDHMTFTEGAPIDTGTTRYDHRHDWRGSLRTPQNPHGTNPTSDGMRWGELRMLFGGATSIVGSGRADGLLRNLDDLSSADQAVGLREAVFQTFSLGDANESERQNCDWNYRYDQEEVAGFDRYLPHVAEGINARAAEEFFCQSRSTDGAEDLTESNTAHIHSIGLTAEDYLRMAADRAQIIWSPRSNISLYGNTAQVVTFANLGGIIALGTDWTYSGSANMARELACADQFNRNQLASYFSDKQLWEMATINAAIATGNGHLLGSLADGKLADIAVFGGTEGQLHRAVLEATNSSVALVMRGGVPLFGESDVVGALAGGCDAVDVCGVTKTVCASSEFGSSFDQIAGAVSGGEAAYPAIFCETIPSGEPTCTPSRPGEYSGIASDNDADGDGVINNSDNCQFVFNPVRPMDSTGLQPDHDSDGLGDACDPDPLIADLDGDGKDNAVDNCPFDANGDQSDGDSDNKGDVCDICPELANPDTACSNKAAAMDVTIVQIQSGDVPEGTVVRVTDAVVTGIGPGDFSIQDPSASSPEFSGVLVYTGGDIAYSIGDQVTVVGEITEFYDNTEITFATVTVTGSTTPIEPTDVTAAQAASEAYEHVLVRVSTGTINTPYDCSADSASCADMNLWEIDGQIVAHDRFYQAADWTAHIGELPVVGVPIVRYERVRLLPRTAADFPPP